jgi:transcriptional regulator with XRE-family HTH domain
MARMKKKSPKAAKYVLTRIRVKAYSKCVYSWKIKLAREAAGLTQLQAATALGWTTQRWSDFERGRHRNPRIGTLPAVCDVLNCGVYALIRLPKESK